MSDKPTLVSAIHVRSSKQMVDVTGPQHEVEVLYRDGVLWVNIDGVCRLRCCQMGKAALVFDIREGPKHEQGDRPTLQGDSGEPVDDP